MKRLRFYPCALVAGRETRPRFVSVYERMDIDDARAQLNVWRKTYKYVYAFWIEDQDSLKIESLMCFTNSMGDVLCQMEAE